MSLKKAHWKGKKCRWNWQNMLNYAVIFFFFFYKKCKKELLIEPNYAGQNAYSRRAYPVPGTGKIGLAPNSHARWVRGDYVSQGSVRITKRKYVVAIWSQLKKFHWSPSYIRLQGVKILWISRKILSSFNIILIYMI